MKRFFDILFVVIAIFIISFIIFNSELVLKNYNFSLFWIIFEWKIIFFWIIFFLIYLFFSWILVRFVFVFNSSKENKLNKKIIELQEKINIKNEFLLEELVDNVKNTFQKIFEKQESKILEKFWNIDSELWKISAEIWYLKSLEKKEEN
jgi:Na+/phosphate symporter